MQLSEKALSYIKAVGVPKSINSNFLISDLENIIYTATFEKDKYYISKNLSKDLISLITKWKDSSISEDLFLMENKPTIKIINNDTENYNALMIFPIYLDKKIERTCYLF